MHSLNKNITPSTRWQALIGILPFVAYGIISMIDKLDQLNPIVIYFYLAFYVLTLLGLLIGWIRGFPLWSYSYLGWSLIIAWWWSNTSIYDVDYGTRIWLPLGIMVLIALLWTRSLSPIKKLFRDITNDWTRLSLVMYTFIAFVFLIYDENHHPYLFIFMAASTIAIAAGTWFYLRSTSPMGRVSSIFGGFASGIMISIIGESTWDTQTYYNLPEMSTPWYLTIFRTLIILIFYSVILFWPVAINFLPRSNNKKTAN